MGFWVEQCMHALFECPEDANEITKNYTKAVSGAICIDLSKIDFRGYVPFW